MEVDTLALPPRRQPSPQRLSDEEGSVFQSPGGDSGSDFDDEDSPIAFTKRATVRPLSYIRTSTTNTKVAELERYIKHDFSCEQEAKEGCKGERKGRGGGNRARGHHPNSRAQEGTWQTLITPSCPCLSSVIL